jgi:uncharacterized membrane protein
VTTRSRDRRDARQRSKAEARSPQSLAVKAVAVQETFSGPLPPPEVLAKYDEIVPGMAERLLTTFERQADHRMTLERKVIDGDIRRSWAGLILGFVFGMALLVGSVFMIASGLAVAGIALIVAELVAIAVALIYTTESRRRERNRKAGQ